MGIENLVESYTPITIERLNDILIKVPLSALILLMGVVLGKTLNFGLRRLSQKVELSKHIRGSFIDLFLVIIRWSIYIIFLNLALDQLQIPALTTFFTAVLVTIPAFVGAIILVVIGFSLAHYLKKIVLNSEIKTAESFSQVMFYFVLYMFGVYALKTAMISFEPYLTNNVVLIFTLVLVITVSYKVSKN